MIKEKTKNNLFIKKWFTLIELLVVITILSIISISWFWYFNWFLDKQELNWELTLFSAKIRDLDYKVKKKEIFDYKLSLSLNNSWALLYYYYENYYDTIYNQSLNIDTYSWSWSITTNNWNWTDLNIWQTKLYVKEKLLKEDFLWWTWTLNYMFDTYENYSVSWYLTWQILNDIYINYFSLKNLDKVNPDFVVLTDINTQEDWEWLSYSWITIENINNKKYIKNNIWWSLITTDLYFIFERNLTKNFIKITN